MWSAAETLGTSARCSAGNGARDEADQTLVGTLALLAGAAAALPAQAGDNNGDFMVRVLATGVLPDTSAGGINVGGAPTFRQALQGE